VLAGAVSMIRLGSGMIKMTRERAAKVDETGQPCLV